MDELRPAIERFRQKTRVPAVLAGVVDRDGTLDVAAVGSRRRDAPDDHALVSDQCHIGSCGKSITSVLYARLVEAGRAEWGTSVPELFDDLSDIHPQWRGSTIDDLLRCRAGVAPNPPRSRMQALFAATSSPTDQRTEAASEVLAGDPKKPGTFVYSNLGYIVAGAAIERAADCTFEEAMRTYVTDPLAMNSFGYGPPPHLRSHAPRLQLGPFVIGRGKPRDDIRADNPPLFTPAGRYHLTLDDWSKFLTVFLRDGGGFLGPDTISHLLAIPAGEPRSIGMGWASAKPYGSVALQGSNTMWSATAIIDAEMSRAAMVVANDGRSSVLRKSAQLAVSLLEAGTAS